MSNMNGPDWYEESERDKVNMLENCFCGNIEEVTKYIHCKVRVNEADEDGVTALQIAAAKGHRNLVEYLIKQGANINQSNHCGMTPFLHACREGHVEIVKILWNNRADIHKTTGLGVTALTLACAGQHIDVIRTLKFFELPVNPAQMLIAPTPLMAACYNRDIAILGFLSHHQAKNDYKIEGLGGLSAESFMIKCGLQYVLNSVQISAVDNFKNKHDLRYAIENDDCQKMQKLLTNPNLAESLTEGLTPLMYAVVMQKYSIAELVIESKCCSIDAQENLLGMTALMFAIIVGNNAMVRLLLKSNAKVGLSLTTKLSFNAIDLLQHSNDLRQDTLIAIYKNYLNIKLSDIEERHSIAKEAKSNFHTLKKFTLHNNVATTSMSALTTTNFANRTLLKMLQSIGLTEQRTQMIRKDSERFNASLLTSHIDWSKPLPFVLAEDILIGNKKPTTIPQPGPENYVILAKGTLLNYLNQGNLLKPFVFGIPTDVNYKSFYNMQPDHFPKLTGNNEDLLKKNRNFCTAQRNDPINYLKSVSRIKLSSSCPNYIDRQLSSSNSTPSTKHRTTNSAELINPQQLKQPQKLSIGCEKVRSAPSRPNSEFQFQNTSNQNIQLQSCLTSSKSLRMGIFETNQPSPLLIPKTAFSLTSTPAGGGTPVLGRNEWQSGITPENLTGQWNLSTKSATVLTNPLDGLRTHKFTKKKSVQMNSPRIQRIALKQAVQQAFNKRQDLQQYYRYFLMEEVDEQQLLSLKYDEILEILKRHVSQNNQILNDITKMIIEIINEIKKI